MAPRTSPPASWTTIGNEKSRSSSPGTEDMEDQLDPQRSAQASPRKRKAPVALSTTKEAKRAKVDTPPLLLAKSRLQSKATSSKLSPLKPAASDGDSSDSLPDTIFRDKDRRRTIGGTKDIATPGKKKRVRRRLVPLPKPPPGPSDDVIVISSDDDEQRTTRLANILSQTQRRTSLELKKHAKLKKAAEPKKLAEDVGFLEVLSSDEERKRLQETIDANALASISHQVIPQQHGSPLEMSPHQCAQDLEEPMEPLSDSASGIAAPDKPMSLRAKGKQKAIEEEPLFLPDDSPRQSANDMDMSVSDSPQYEPETVAEDYALFEPTEEPAIRNSPPTIPPVRATTLHNASSHLPRVRVKSLLNGGVDGFFKEAFLSIRNQRDLPPHKTPTPQVLKDDSPAPEPMETSPVSETEEVPFEETPDREIRSTSSDAQLPVPPLPSVSPEEKSRTTSANPSQTFDSLISEPLSVSTIINNAWIASKPKPASVSERDHEIIDLTLSDDEPTEYDSAAVAAAVRLTSYLSQKLEHRSKDPVKVERMEQGSLQTPSGKSAELQDRAFSIEAKLPTEDTLKINSLSTLEIIRNAIAHNQRAEREAARAGGSRKPSLPSWSRAVVSPDSEIRSVSIQKAIKPGYIEDSPTPAIIEGMEQMHVDAPSPVNQEVETEEEEEVEASIEMSAHPSTSDDDLELETAQKLQIQPSSSGGTTLQQQNSDDDDNDKPLRWVARRTRSSRNSSAQSVLAYPGAEPQNGDSSSDESLPYITFDTCDWWIQRPQIHFSRDVPHQIQDRFNHMDEFYRKSDTARKIFEAEIVKNTQDEEPEAPLIQVFNEFDDETTPPWEFHYSNKIFLGEGVPPPDYSKLKGCGCRGRCDPNNKGCLCVQRHQKYFERGDIAEGGFVYDNEGRLKHQGYPAFECNILCACNDSCPNRVVQNGRKHTVNIVKTKAKGWGVFAGEETIPANTFLGIYAGEYLTEDMGEERGKVYNKFGRTYLFNIDWWYLRDEGDSDTEPEYVMDAYHAGNFTRFLNHSCDPNCWISPVYINEPDDRKPILVLFTRVEVKPWEELCFSYFGPPSDDEGEGEAESVNEVKDNLGESDAIYVACQCGAERCKGKVFIS